MPAVIGKHYLDEGRLAGAIAALPNQLPNE
jgi:hypothetical protein